MILNFNEKVTNQISESGEIVNRLELQEDESFLISRAPASNLESPRSIGEPTRGLRFSMV